MVVCHLVDHSLYPAIVEDVPSPSDSRLLECVLRVAGDSARAIKCGAW